MAVAFVRSGSVVTTASSSLSEQVNNFVVNAGELNRELIVFVGHRISANETVGSVFYEPDPVGAPGVGVQFFTLEARTPTSSSPRIDMWSLTAPAPSVGAGGRITITLTLGQNPVKFAIHALLFEGVNQTTPIVDAQSKETVNNSSSFIALIASATGDMTISSTCVRGRLGVDYTGLVSTSTPGTPNPTEVLEVGSSGAGGFSGNIIIHSGHRVSAGTTVTMRHLIQPTTLVPEWRQVAGILQAAPTTTPVTQTGIIQLEAMNGVTQQGAIPIEAVASLFAQAPTNIESLMAGILQTAVIPLEALQALTQAAAINLEARGGVVGSAIIPIEARQGITLQRILNTEALAALSRTAIINIEARQGITQQALINIEAISAAVGVQQTAVINIESLAPLSVQAQANLEALALLASKTAILNIESRAGVLQTGIINIEAMSGVIISQTAIIPIESLQGIQSLSIVNVESIAQATRTQVLNLESLGGLFGTAVINIESAGTAGSDVFVDAGLPWFWIDSSKFKGVSFYLEAQLMTNDAVSPKFARARLEESIDNGLNFTYVGGSEVSSIHTQRSVPVRSPALLNGINITGNKLYRITFGGVPGGTYTIFSGGVYVI